MVEYKYVQKEKLEDELDEFSEPVIEDEAKKLFDSWKMGGSIWTRPAMYEDMLIFGSNDGHLYALDRLTGEMKWQFLAGANIISSPLISEGIIYFGSFDNKFYAVDARTGQKMWELLTGGRIASTAAIADGLIYFGSEDGKLYCLSKDGTKQWEFLTGGPVVATPAVINEKVYFGSFDKRVYCIEGGRKLWSFLAGGYAGSCTIVDMRTGQTVAGFRAERPESSRCSGNEENLRICFGSFDGYFYALKADGSLTWKFQADNIVAIIRGYTASDGIIYFGADRLFAVDVRDGVKAWSFRADDRVGDTVPLYHNGTLFTGAYDGNLYALDSKTGGKAFTFRTGGATFSPPLLHNGILYFGSNDTYLYALDLAAGKTIWTFKTGGNPTPIAWRGMLKSFNPLQRLRRFWKPELPKSAYEKEERKVEWAKGYGAGSNPYRMERTDVAYFGHKQYGAEINLDEEAKKRRDKRW